MNINSKSKLAKLLATEDISLEHRNVPTAYFDLKERKVVLPNWKDMPVFLQDLLIGHEIGHALVTPQEGWHDAVCESGAAFKSYLNVIEDARNERLVKQRYPGLAKSFYQGYQLLFKKKFFGEIDNPNSLLLIDRINLHYKVGSFLNIQFSDAERVFLDAIDVAVEWDEVVDIAKALFNAAKEQQSQTDKSVGQPTAFQQDSEDELEEQESAEGSAPSDDDGDFDQDENGEWSESPYGEEDSGEGEFEETESDDEPTGASDETTESEQGESEDDQDDQDGSAEEFGAMDIDESIQTSGDEVISSATDRAFRANESRLVDDTNESCVDTAYMPKFYKKERFVFPASKVWDSKFEWMMLGGKTVKEIETKLYNDFMSRNRDAVNQLVMQFEMKRKASELRKTQIHNTGKLNEDKLWAYKLTEDLFLSSEVTPTGKNHGMYMLVDMSGSMHGHMAGTIEQTLIQVAFCKKVGIPFRVMGFTGCTQRLLGDDFYGENHNTMVAAAQSHNENEIQFSLGTGLIELISSDCGSALYDKAFKMMLQWKSSFQWSDGAYINYYSQPSHLQLGCTPLSQGLLLAVEDANKFKFDNQVEILNTIVLSDGGGTDNIQIIKGDSVYSSLRETTKLIIKSGITSVKSEGPLSNGGHKSHYGSRRYPTGVNNVFSAHAALAFYKEMTGSRMIQFWIETRTKKQIKEAYCWLTYQDSWGFYDGADGEFGRAYKNQMLKSGFMEVENDAWGYDSCFIIAGGKTLNDTENELTVKSEKKADILRGFKSFQKKKSTSRQFLNRFVERVA